MQLLLRSGRPSRREERPASTCTTKANIIFHDSFILDRGVGELPAGTYDIEIDGEEILATDRTGYRRTVI
jgi:hypothetical protein